MLHAALAGLLRSVERVVPALEERERVLLRSQLGDPGRDEHPARRCDGLLGELGLKAPVELLRYTVDKGSITVEGTSLTVAGLGAEGFAVALIPHTLEVTTLGELAPGDRVNLEADVLAKYVEKLLHS